MQMQAVRLRYDMNNAFIIWTMWSTTQMDAFVKIMFVKLAKIWSHKIFEHKIFWLGLENK